MSEDAKDKLARILVNKKLYGQPNLSEAYQKALGRLTINLSLIHFLLESMGWQLWGLSIRSREILTKDLRVTHLVEKLKASANEIPTAERPQFLALLKRAKQAAEQRNELLHSLWIIIDGEPVLCHSRKRGALSGSEVPSVDDIQEFSSSVMRLAGDLTEFRTTLSKYSLRLSSQ